MLSSNFFNSSAATYIANLIVIFISFLFALSFHEFAHAFTAYLLGDDTAKKAGRLTLNPFAHLDLWGTIFLLIFHIGWAKPVPFDSRNFKRPKIYSVLTALAGPFSNFILAYIFLIFLKYIPLIDMPLYVTKSLIILFQYSVQINVMLGVFNLLPIPPLDGSHILTEFLYPKFPELVNWVYKYSMLLIFALFFIPASRKFLTMLIFKTMELIQRLVF